MFTQRGGGFFKNCMASCVFFIFIDDSEPEAMQLSSTIALFEDEEADEEVAIDPAEERALVLSSFGPSASTTTPKEDEQGNEEGDLPLACFPRFPMIEDHDFVLLLDIMHSFNICEDYCLAAISRILWRMI